MKSHDLKVAIGPSSFGHEDDTPLKMLLDAGISIIPNPYGRRYTEEETIAILQDADGLLAGLEPLNRKVLSSAKKLKAIARVGIGMDNVDQSAAGSCGIKVSNTPEGPTDAVAEMTVACLLAMLRRIIPANAALHAGSWSKQTGDSLKGKNVLLIGFGRIGRRVAELLTAFGANIHVCDPVLTESEAHKYGVACASLEDGLSAADIVSLHAAGTEEILGPAELGMLRSGSILLNSARAKLINETALIEAVESGKIAQAWFDVFPEEPYKGPLIHYPQLLLTPHTGTYTRLCRLEMETAAVRNLLRDLGTGQDSVND